MGIAQDDSAEQVLNGSTRPKKRSRHSGSHSGSNYGLVNYALRQITELDHKRQLDKKDAEVAKLEDKIKDLEKEAEKKKQTKFFFAFFGFIVGAVLIMWLTVLSA